MCSANPWEAAMAPKMGANNPFFFFLVFFILSNMVNPYNTDGGWWPLLAASALRFDGYRA